MDDEDERFKCNLGMEMTKRLIGCSITFTTLNQTIHITRFISVTLSETLSSSDGTDSYYKINFSYIGNSSFPIPDRLSGLGFSIDRRAEQFGFRLGGLLEKGEVFINIEENSIKLTVNVFNIRKIEDEINISLIIKITIPPKEEREKIFKRYKQQEKDIYTDEDTNTIKKAFQVGATAVGAVILAKIIKAGIGAILSGPFGAFVGLAT